MPSFPLNEKQKRLLSSIVPGLRDRSVKLQWSYIFGDGGIASIFGLDDEGVLYREYWRNSIEYADFVRFEDCGFVSNHRSHNTGGNFVLDDVKIIIAFENNFTFPEPGMQKLYLPKRAKDVAKYLTEAFDKEWIVSYIECVDVTAGSDPTIQVTPVSGVLDKGQFVLPPIETLMELSELIEIKEILPKPKRKWGIRLTSKLHEAVDNAFHIWGRTSYVDQRTEVNIQNSSAVVNINTVLNNSTQQIINASHLTEDFKAQFSSLIGQLREILEQAPEEQRDATEDVAKYAENLAIELASQQPSKGRLRTYLANFRLGATDLATAVTLAPYVDDMPRVIGEIQRLVETVIQNLR